MLSGSLMSTNWRIHRSPWESARPTWHVRGTVLRKSTLFLTRTCRRSSPAVIRLSRNPFPVRHRLLISYLRVRDSRGREARDAPWRVILTPLDQSSRRFTQGDDYRRATVLVATVTARAVASRGSACRNAPVISGKVQRTPGHDSRCHPHRVDGTYCSKFPFVRRCATNSPERVGQGKAIGDIATRRHASTIKKHDVEPDCRECKIFVAVLSTRCIWRSLYIPK